MMPSQYEAALVLGRIPYAQIDPFHRYIVLALDAANSTQRTAMAQAFPGLVIAWTMKHGTENERATLRTLAR